MYRGEIVATREQVAIKIIDMEDTLDDLDEILKGNPLDYSQHNFP